jgi:hypothetical protein
MALERTLMSEPKQRERITKPECSVTFYLPHLPLRFAISERDSSQILKMHASPTWNKPMMAYKLINPSIQLVDGQHTKFLPLWSLQFIPSGSSVLTILLARRILATVREFAW